MKTSEYLLLIIICLLSYSHVFSKKAEIEIRGKVLAIKDGDTIEILFEGRPLTVRLAHIDCPERKQPFGSAAKKFTSGKCFGQTVKIITDNKFDRYKRLIGAVINVKDENVNKELVMAGLAWHFKKILHR